MSDTENHPKKKEQHFVPKFYLKYFSINSLEKELGIFNIASSKFIPNGKLKKQGYKDYFYGSDLKIENILSKLEGEAASIIKSIINENIVPVSLTKEHRAISF